MKHVEEFVVQDTIFKGQENSGTALELIETTAQTVNSTFVSNRKGSYKICSIYDSDFGCRGDGFIGGAIIATKSTIDVSQSKFEYSGADFGGALFAEHSTINLIGNVFINNDATKYGGVLRSNSSNITIERSEFHDNSATWGGVLVSSHSNITIETSEFQLNSATNKGGVLVSYSSTITIETSEFYSCHASDGGVLQSYSSTITIKESEFQHNSATYYGGVLRSDSSIITIENSKFHENNAATGGVLHSHFNSIITMEESEFQYNSATVGGVLYSPSSNITIKESKFQHNNAAHIGGVLHSSLGSITIEASEFRNNNATTGGALFSTISNITIEGSVFQHNSATKYGGVLNFYRHNNITIKKSEFQRNSAILRGGVMSLHFSNIIIEESEFHNNNATNEGGVLHSFHNNITIGGSIFTKNSSPIGAVIYSSVESIIQHHSYLLIDNNWADRYVVIYLSESDFIGHCSENATFSNNLGSLVAFNSEITFMGYARFAKNKPSQTITGDFQEGGAITLFQSSVYFDGVCNLEHNLAETGGAILSTESKLYVNGDVTIAHNAATRNGGGVYFSISELNCEERSTLVIFNNTAVQKGGGLHAIGSSIKATSLTVTEEEYIGTIINFTKNVAERGGGLSLEANTKLNVLKYAKISSNTTIFTANKADYGGAVYVDDTNSGTCASDLKTECFFQVFAVYERGLQDNDLNTHVQCIYFSQNSATISGSTFYGGLLDRCTVSQLAEAHKLSDVGIAYFMYVSIPTYYTHKAILITTNISVSSDPVQVCLCINNDHDCIHRSYIEVKKGEMFSCCC